MQIPDEFLGQQIPLTPESPVLCARDVLLLGFVQFAAVSDMTGDQVARFLGVSGVASSGWSKRSVTV